MYCGVSITRNPLKHVWEVLWRKHFAWTSSKTKHQRGGLTNHISFYVYNFWFICTAGSIQDEMQCIQWMFIGRALMRCCFNVYFQCVCDGGWWYNICRFSNPDDENAVQWHVALSTQWFTQDLNYFEHIHQCTLYWSSRHAKLTWFQQKKTKILFSMTLTGQITIFINKNSFFSQAFTF